MVQSPTWAANWFAASQEIPRISRNPEVHYRTHKRPPPVSIRFVKNRPKFKFNFFHAIFARRERSKRRVSPSAHMFQIRKDEMKLGTG